jgi:hypothetical protein
MRSTTALASLCLALAAAQAEAGPYANDLGNGMLAFHKAGTGKAVIAEMPLVQSRMRPLPLTLQQLTNDTMAQLKATRVAP